MVYREYHLGIKCNIWFHISLSDGKIYAEVADGYFTDNLLSYSSHVPRATLLSHNDDHPGFISGGKV